MLWESKQMWVKGVVHPKIEVFLVLWMRMCCTGHLEVVCTDPLLQLSPCS